jgi:uncharacterized membrane protein
MRRRRSVPWLHRWSRQIIGAIAIAGALLTGYLTIVKLTGGEAACSAGATTVGSCGDVLNSPYAIVLGLPLSLFGFLAYGSMATFALSPLLIDREKNKDFKAQLENWTWLLLLAGATAMTVFSGYLMYVLAFKLNAVCYYCIGSALFALTMLTLTILGQEWEDLGQIFVTGFIVALLTIVGTLAIYANIEQPDELGRVRIPLATTEAVAPKGWEISTTSGASEIELAQYLTEKGAKMFGAYWCPHCYEQKQLFGKEAFSKINYIECAEGGNNPQPQLCSQVGIKSFPSWQINGKLEPGAKELEKLAKATGYQGTQKFKYKLR